MEDTHDRHSDRHRKYVARHANHLSVMVRTVLKLQGRLTIDLCEDQQTALDDFGYHARMYVPCWDGPTRKKAHQYSPETWIRESDVRLERVSGIIGTASGG
jgi:hypothetical protein